ncbi:MAG TPA: hypothetical protein ENK57_14370 [Polyangiaceae bacterium]|nr:hypothetical protein [Polyangiaceae bacterium]
MTLLTATTSCSVGAKIGAAACPALSPEVSALDASLSTNPRVNAKVRAFVQASKDMAWISSQLEAEVASACRRMGADLGIPPHQMQPSKGPGGAAAGACEPVAQTIDAILRQGIRLWITVVPPECRANANAMSRCNGVCNMQSDAECAASCQAHANVHASCRPAQVSVRVAQGQQLAGTLVATLQANLPSLINAQLSIGQRLANDAKTVAQVGSNMPRVVGDAGSKALACIGAGADAAARATVRMNVSVRASATVTTRVQGG